MAQDHALTLVEPQPTPSLDQLEPKAMTCSLLVLTVGYRLHTDRHAP